MVAATNAIATRIGTHLGCRELMLVPSATFQNSRFLGTGRMDPPRVDTIPLKAGQSLLDFQCGYLFNESIHSALDANE